MSITTTSSTTPRAARTAGPGEWLLTAPHAEHRQGARRSAWGPFHIRRNGEQRTACGQSTLTWHTFWELKLDVLLARVCPDCATATRTTGSANALAR